MFVAYNNLVFWVSLRPGKDIPAFVGRIDKILHLIVFAILYAVTLPAFRMMRRFVTSPEFASLGWTMLIGALTEWLQRRIPGRQATVGDFVADAAGGGLVLFVVKYFR